MVTSKINIGIAISRNFDVVKIEFLDEPISYDSDKELRAGIRRRFNILREEIDIEFRNIQK